MAVYRPRKDLHIISPHDFDATSSRESRLACQLEGVILIQNQILSCDFQGIVRQAEWRITNRILGVTG